jgi:hypothetical protein
VRKSTIPLVLLFLCFALSAFGDPVLTGIDRVLCDGLEARGYTITECAHYTDFLLESVEMTIRRDNIRYAIVVYPGSSRSSDILFPDQVEQDLEGVYEALSSTLEQSGYRINRHGMTVDNRLGIQFEKGGVIYDLTVTGRR